jgi:hypothetical protein
MHVRGGGGIIGYAHNSIGSSGSSEVSAGARYAGPISEAAEAAIDRWRAAQQREC